jgi:hypothetical protein
VGAALLGAVSIWTSGRSAASFDDVIAVRVLTKPDRQAYFLRHGMPRTIERLRWHLADQTNPHDPFFTAPDLASFRHWTSRKGRITYLLYAAEHPGWAVITPLRSPETLGGPVANPPLDGYGGPGYESLLPAEWQRLLFEDKPAALVLEVFAVIALAGLSMARRDRVTWLLPAAVAALAVPHALIAWHGDTLEVGRHAVVAAIQLRIGLVMTAIVLADRIGGPAISARPTPNLH